MEKFSLIITAGGTSSRYGKTNKLLEVINGKTVIEHTLSKFSEFKQIDEIIIPANVSIIDSLFKLFISPNIMIIKGGNTRQESVYKALEYVNNDYVLIHDGARPLVNHTIINDVLNSVIKNNAVSVMTKTTDTIKEVDNTGRIIKTIDRTRLYNTQTPQAFKTELIKNAHNSLKGKNYTDDASMLEELNCPVYIVEGDYTNIKITTKSDLDFAKIYI